MYDNHAIMLLIQKRISVFLYYTVVIILLQIIIRDGSVLVVYGTCSRRGV